MLSLINKIKNKETVFYKNPLALKNPKKYLSKLDYGMDEIIDASNRMDRFAPLISILFPKTEDGIIESPFVPAPKLKAEIHPNLKGSLWLKLDSHLEVAGSIKARGGLYEVLKIAEEILFNAELLKEDDDYTKILEPEMKNTLAKHTISVASTGNLGLSIGIMGASLGFCARVHMSHDAKQWKKNRLTAKGVVVVEHEGDFTYAAAMGRNEALNDEMVHFVDDERSKNLFFGYAVSALRISRDFREAGIVPTRENPVILYLPCGVGGAPGGITFGFKSIYNDAVKCYFAEPVSSPSMLLGVLTKKYGKTNVNNYGLDNITELDGLAVASPSDFVAPLAEKLCDGFYTIQDKDMFRYLYLLDKTEGIHIEPSAAAGISGPIITENTESDAYHIIWTTGGLFVPDDIYDKMNQKGRTLNENCRV